MTNLVVIYSGGMDSLTLLTYVERSVMADYHSLTAISFDYGQRHKRELAFAEQVCREKAIPHRIVRMTELREMLGGSALTDDKVEVPFGHYAAETMRKTVVPGRNTIMLAIAMGITEAMPGPGVLYYGAQDGANSIYPDCRPAYLHAMQHVVDRATDFRVQLRAPFINEPKASILRRGLAMDVDYSQSWTCYSGGVRPCGKCGSCVKRLEAFAEVGVEDPLDYEDRESWKTYLREAS